MQAPLLIKALILSLAAGQLFSPTVGVAELYKWTDEQGHLHITDAPPAGTHKKSPLIVVPAPQPALPRKTGVPPVAPERSRAEARPLQVPRGIPSTSDPSPIQLTIEGLNPFQATAMSPWQVFDGSERDARAPVQSWKDNQGLDHFADVLPATKGGTVAGGEGDDRATTPALRKGKEPATGVVHSRHHATE